jgi:hypothetical protein
VKTRKCQKCPRRGRETFRGGALRPGMQLFLMSPKVPPSGLNLFAGICKNPQHPFASTERLVPEYQWALSVTRIALDSISSQNSLATCRPLPDIFCHRLRLSFEQRPKRVIFIGSRLTFDVPPNQTSHKSSLLFLTWSPSQTATEPLSTNLATEAFWKFIPD